MITTRQIKKIVKQAYPFNKYPFAERRKLRRLLTDEILSYLEEHHDTTCDDLKKLFINEELAFLSDTPKFQINLKILFLIFIINTYLFFININFFYNVYNIVHFLIIS